MERTVLRIASEDVMSLNGDCQSEKRATDLNQEKFLVRINEGEFIKGSEKIEMFFNIYQLIKSQLVIVNYPS